MIITWLAIRQPYAHFICYDGKDVENRTFARENPRLRRSPNSTRLCCESADGGAVSNFLNHSVDLRAFAKPLLAARLPVPEGSDASNKKRYKAGAE